MTIDILDSRVLPPDMPGAMCAQTDPNLFFPPPMGGQGDAARAKRLCHECDWRLRCLEWAVETNQEYGIWGGTTHTERKQLRRSA